VIDLEAYCARINYSGARTPTLETLAALHLAHPAAIPFENLDPVLGHTVALDESALQAKMIEGGRGGYCYEQNGLFYRVLTQLGFAITGLAARVLRGRLEPNASPRSHMLLRCDIAGETFIADVGFGVLSLTAPVRLYATAIQKTPHGDFRIAPEGDGFTLHSFVDGSWDALYTFSLEKNLLQDYEAANWYRSTHPQSRFVQNLMVARPLPGIRLSLLNNQFSRRRVGDDSVERRELRSGAEIADLLEHEFGIALPGPRAAVEERLDRLIRFATVLP
jgi:N-hydroxyarylamine O-acetyltransferase